MKVLIDECVDWRLSRDIIGHDVKTARQMGWSTVRNGELLALAANQFDIFLTVDRNLSFQQNVPAFAIAVIVICAKSNRLSDLRPLVPELLASIPRAQPGKVMSGPNPALERTGRSTRALGVMRRGTSHHPGNKCCAANWRLLRTGLFKLGFAP